MDNGPIVVASDFSARSDRAVDRAIGLARQLSRPLKLVHAIEPARSAEIDRDRIERRMRELVGDTAAEIELLCPEDKVTDALVDAVSDCGGSLLVLAVARYNSVGDYFLGTAVDHVLRHCKVPTLVVKRRPSGPYTRVVVGTDFSPAASAVLQKTRALLPDAHIHVVHAYHVPYEAWQKADYVREELREHVEAEMERFTAGQENVTGECVEGETGRVIERAIERHDCQLAAIGSHGYGGFRQALLGSTTSDLLRQLDADVVVFRPEE